jgi:hypothetical protein
MSNWKNARNIVTIQRRQIISSNSSRSGLLAAIYFGTGALAPAICHIYAGLKPRFQSFRYNTK